MTYIENYESRSGRQYRLKSRDKNHKKFIEIGKSFAHNLIQEHGFSPRNITDEGKYNKTYGEILEKVEKNLRRGRTQKAAKTVLAKHARDVINANNLDVEVVKPQTISEPLASAIDFRANIAAQDLLRWDLKFKSHIQELANKGEVSPEYGLGLILFSLMRNDLILNQTVLKEIVRQFEHGFDLAYQDRRTYISTIAPTDNSMSCISNYRSGNNEYCLFQRCYIGAQTLTLLKICAERGLSCSKLTQPQIFTLIRNAIWGDDIPQQKIRSMKALGAAIAHQAILNPQSSLSPILMQVALGKAGSACVAPHSWQALQNEPQKLSCYVDLGNSTVPVKEKIRDKHTGQNLGDFYDIVIKATKLDNSSEDSLEKLQSNLSGLISLQEAGSSFWVILKWIYSLTLDDKTRLYGRRTKLAPTTVKKYCRLFISRWIVAAGDDDISVMSSEDLLEIFEDMIEVETPRIQDDDNKLGGLIVRLVDYSNRQLLKRDNINIDLPTIEEIQDLTSYSGHGKTRFVKAHITSYPFISEVVNFLLDKDAEQLALITILGFRLGLRISEILKLTRDSFEYGFLRILKNRYGYNKSQAGRRRLNLKAFLSKEEYALFIKYFNASGNSKPNDLMFTPGNGKKWKAGEISRIIVDLLRRTSGNPNLTFHSLRHSAASIFQLVIEDVNDLAESLTGFGPNKLREIKQAIMLHPNQERGKYWALASTMGHASPFETLRSYCHLNQFIVHHKLCVTENSDFQVLAEIVGFPKNRFDNSRDFKQAYHEKFGAFMKLDQPVWACKAQLKSAPIQAKPPALQALDLLSWIEDGKSFEIGCSNFGVDETRAQNYLLNACLLWNLLSSRNKPKLFDRKRKVKRTASNLPFLLLPNGLGRTTNKDILVTKIELLRRTLQNSRTKEEKTASIQKLQQCAKLIATKPAKDDEFTFTKPHEAGLVIDALKSILPIHEWIIVLQFHSDYETEAKNHWRALTVSPKERKLGASKIKPKYPTGQLLLKYVGPSMKPDISLSGIPRSLCHLLLITMCSEQDFQGWNIDLEQAKILYEDLSST